MKLEELMEKVGCNDKKFVCKTENFDLYFIFDNKIKGPGKLGKPLFARDYGSSADIVPGYLHTEYALKYCKDIMTSEKKRD